jgi:hypothetical protein
VLGCKHGEVPRKRSALFAIPVAVLAEAGSWRDLEPDRFAMLVYVAIGGALLALGAFAGWRSLVLFGPSFIIAAAIEEAWIYDGAAPDSCDPFCSSPSVGVWFGLPFFLLVIALGMGARSVVQSVRSQSSA